MQVIDKENLVLLEQSPRSGSFICLGSEVDYLATS